MGVIFISFWFDFLVLVVLVLSFAYYAIKKRFSYWESRGVYTPKPKIPYGNIEGMILRKSHLAHTFQEIYKETKSMPYVGFYMMIKPCLLVNDLDLAKIILTKDFVHFSDHGFPLNEELEPLTGHLFNLCGPKWKNLRAKLTPAFTSSRTRIMFEKIQECAGEMLSYLDTETRMDRAIDAKEVLAKFGNDVIASCAFGIECNTFKNPDEKFRKMGKRIFAPGRFEDILRRLDFFVPNVFTRLKVMLVSRDVEDFFIGVVEETVNYRQKHNIVRNDFMQLLIQLKTTGTISEDDNSETPVDDGTRLTMMQLAAQVFVFFLAGFETSSSTSSFALFELATNPDVQETLIKEVDEIYAKYNGKFTYDSLAEMTYLTKVIEETMRKHPPLPVLFRVCTKEYILPDTNVKIDKGTPVMIPIYGIQRDPEIYSNPDKFDPERFNPENRAARHHFSFLPFGEGPRICIGSRFGMMQTKLGLATLLSKYEVSVCEKTSVPLVYDKRSFVLTSDEGLWLQLKKRNK